MTAPFQFRLGRLLSARRAVEEQARGRWGGAHREAEAREGESRERASERAGVENEVREMARGSIDPAQLRAADTYLEILGRRLIAARSGAERASIEAEIRRRELVDAARRVKLLEKLEEKSHAGWKERGLAAEARERDDRAPREELP